MRGVKLVISTIIVIFVLSISCYAALADTGPYDPMGIGDTKNPFGANSMLYSTAPSCDGFGTIDYVQQVGGDGSVFVLQIDMWDDNYYNMGCQLLAGDGASFNKEHVLTHATSYLSINPGNPTCMNLCSAPVSDVSGYQTLLGEWEMNNCGSEAHLTGLTYAVTEEGFDGSANMLAATDFDFVDIPDFVDIFSTESEEYKDAVIIEPFVYIAPSSALLHVINIDIFTAPSGSIILECYDSDCNLQDTIPAGFDLFPGQKLTVDCQSYPDGTAVLKSDVAALGVTAREENENGLALYNIYGARNASDVFDSESWMTGPSGGYTADVYLLNPNNADVSATLEVFRNGEHQGVYARDIGPYCMKKIETGNLDEIVPTVFKATFNTPGIPHTEMPGNAVLMITGTGTGGLSIQQTGDVGFAALESIPSSIKLGPDIFEGHVDYYSPTFFDECSLGGLPPVVIGSNERNPGIVTESIASSNLIKGSPCSSEISAAGENGYIPDGLTKTMIEQDFSNQNNGNKIDVTEEIYSPSVIWDEFGIEEEYSQKEPPIIPIYAPIDVIGPFRVEPFSVLELNPETLGIEYGVLGVQDNVIIIDGYGCGSSIITTEVQPQYVMNELGQNTFACCASYTVSNIYGEQKDIEGAWKDPVIKWEVDPCMFIECDDSIECTIDECNSFTEECEYTPDDSLCDDGIACFDDFCSDLVGCIHIDNCPFGYTCNSLTGYCEDGPVLESTEEPPAREYGITGEVTKQGLNKTSATLGLILIAVIAGLIFLFKGIKPKGVKIKRVKKGR